MTTTSRTVRGPSSRMQGLVLIALGIVCACIAWLVHPDHELALLALGLGFFVAHISQRARFFIPAVIVTLFGATNVAWLYGVIPTGALYGAYVLDAALGTLVVTLAARRGYVGAHPLSPSLLIGLIGVLLVGTSNAAINATGFYIWFVSFWMPAIVLTTLGLVSTTIATDH